MAILFTLRVFEEEKSAEEISPKKKYFSYFVLTSGLGLEITNKHFTKFIFYNISSMIGVIEVTCVYILIRFSKQKSIALSV